MVDESQTTSLYEAIKAEMRAIKGWQPISTWNKIGLHLLSKIPALARGFLSTKPRKSMLKASNRL